MANSRVNLTESVIRKIMEGADPRTAIDTALDEKAGYHKEKRIRDGKAEVVNVKNRKRKVHHTLTPGQKKAIKKAHSAAANKKRAKSIKKGAKMGLYKEGISFMSEAEEEVVQGLSITCPACGEGALEIVDGEEDLVLVCPECGETFVICATSEIEDDEDDDDDDKDEQEEKAEAEEPAEDAEAEEPAEDEDAEKTEESCDKCGGEEECDDSGLFFAAE